MRKHSGTKGDGLKITAIISGGLRLALIAILLNIFGAAIVWIRDQILEAEVAKNALMLIVGAVDLLSRFRQCQDSTPAQRTRFWSDNCPPPARDKVRGVEILSDYASRYRLRSSVQICGHTAPAKMATANYLSVGKTFRPEQEQFIVAFEDFLRARDLEPHTLGRNEWKNGAPLKPIKDLDHFTVTPIYADH